MSRADVDAERKAWEALRKRWDLKPMDDLSLARDAFFAGWRASTQHSALDRDANRSELRAILAQVRYDQSKRIPADGRDPRKQETT